MKDIKNYEGIYAVTEDGQVFSYRGNKYLQPTVSENGYASVLFSVNNVQKRFYIHRLVAEAFLEDFDESLEVNHIDECKLNNCVSNLEMVTRKYNINYGSRSIRQGKTRGKPVICLENNTVYYSAREAARVLGLSASGVSRCCNGLLKSTGGYHFLYQEV